MCRNIRTLFNFDPPATPAEIEASAIQFVRKLSGFTRPSQANEAAFNAAVVEVAAAATRLLDALRTNAPARNREVEAARARARAAERYGYRRPRDEGLNGRERRRQEASGKVAPRKRAAQA